MYLTREQVEALDYSACLKVRKQLEEYYPFDMPIEDLNPGLWTQADEAINSLLYLEDRIAQYLDTRKSTLMPE